MKPMMRTSFIGKVIFEYLNMKEARELVMQIPGNLSFLGSGSG